MTCGGGQPDHEDKQLLHWVNSLPVASCLLVDSFDQLRSGDVFCDIFRLVHHNENDGQHAILGPPAQKLQTVLTSVLQLVSAAEWSQRYLLREPETILDILDGSYVAIATLLRALKKRWDLVARQVQHRDRLDAQLQRQIEKQLPLPAATRPIKHSLHDWNPSTQQCVKVSTKRVPETSARPCSRSTHHSGHRRMIDAADVPCDMRAFGATTKTTEARDANDLAEFTAHLTETKRATAFAICKWIRSLGIPLGFEASLEKATASSFLDSAANVFKDGVILCQLTAVVIYHLGASSAKAKLRPVAAQPGTFVPQGCCLQPVTLAQKRHNLQLALHLLREIPEVTHPVVCALDLYDPLASAFDTHIWTLLHVLYKLSRSKERGPPPPRDRPSPPPAPPVEPSPSKNDVVFPSVSPEQVHAVRDWLQHLGLDASSTSTGLLADPYRNGSFLCDVLNRLVARDRELTFHQTPKTLHQAKANLQVGFHCLHAQRISLPPLYWSLEHGYGLLKGHFHAVYGFWWHLLQSLHFSAVTPTAPLATTKELATRKILVAEWLRTKGFLSDLRHTTAQQHWPFDKLKPCLVNGTLLLAMASALTQSSDGCHVVLDPMPTSVARTHIAQALELLRPLPAMPQRFLWCEDKVRAGDDAVLLGLLEDLQSLGDAPEVVAPRECQPRAVFSNNHLLPIREEDDDANDDGRSTKHHLECVHTQAAISSSRQWREIDIDTDLDLLPRAHSDTMDVEEEARPPSLPSPHAPPQFLRRQTMIPRPIVASAALLAVETEPLTTWLEHLQVKPIPCLEGHTLDAFRDGLVLVQVIEKVEHIRVLEGVCRQPKGKKAPCLHNIKKVLDILRLKKTMPLVLLRKDREIYAGDRAVILTLLDQIRKAYGYQHLVVVSKPSSG